MSTRERLLVTVAGLLALAAMVAVPLIARSF